MLNRAARLEGFERAAPHAPLMLLRVSEKDHDQKPQYYQSAYEFLRHGHPPTENPAIGGRAARSLYFPLTPETLSLRGLCLATLSCRWRCVIHMRWRRIQFGC